MVSDKLHILYVEDNPADFRLLTSKLNRETPLSQVSFHHVQSVAEARSYLAEDLPDIILLDLSLPDASGLQAVDAVKQAAPDLPVVVLTGNTDRQQALTYIKAGAQDYLVKGDFSAEMFMRVCNYAAERTKIQNQLGYALRRVEALNAELQFLNGELSKTVSLLKEEKMVVEQKNQQINSFINLIIHDLKNPVTAINALTGMLLKDKDRLTIPALKYISQIRYSSSSMLDNILSIIDALHLNEGNFKLSMAADNPYFTLNSAIDRFVVEAIQKNIIVEIRYEKNLPPVYFDKRSLNTVVGGLMDFCIQHSEGDSRLLVQCEDTPDWVVVSFSDRGLVLSAEDVEMAFADSFSYQDPTRSENSTLSHVNLALAQKLVMAMGGTIGLDFQEKKKGVVFWFKLRKATASQEAMN